MSPSTLVHLPFTHGYLLKKHTQRQKHVNESQQDASLYNMIHIKVIFEGPFLVKAFSLIHIMPLSSASQATAPGVSVYMDRPPLQTKAQKA